MLKIIRKNKTDKNNKIKKPDRNAFLQKLFSRVVRVIAILTISAVLVYGIRERWILNQVVNYKNNADRVIVTVDGDEITLSDMAYYIMYEECVTEKAARIYNPDTPKDYWNTRNGGKIISGEAHKAVMGKTVHDWIFYKAARKKGIKLTADEKEYLKTRKEDFWEDLLDEQYDNMYTSKKAVNETMDRMALAQKYQRQLADKMNINYHRLDWDAFEFEPIKKEHKIKVSEKLWDRIRIGEVTIRHYKYSPVPTGKNKTKGDESDGDKNKN
jgi:hypothetical protein